MTTKLDHLVLGAETLAQGIHYVESLLGVTVPPGGEHPRYGTHNRVMRLGDDCYFEIIAIDPAATPEKTPRWYGLDDPRIKSRISRSPALIAWVASVSDLTTVADAAHWIDGEITEISRGNMHWQMLLPKAGLADDPLLPWFIHWPEGQHPLPGMQSLDCSLARIGAAVPDPDYFSACLNSVGAQSLIDVEDSGTDAPGLQVSIQSPKGRIDLPWA